MKQLRCLLFVSLLAGSTLPLEEANSQGLDNGEYRPMMSYCYHTSSGETCFTPYLASNSLLETEPLKASTRWCNSTVPGSSLIIINSTESQRTVEIFIGRQVLANETIVMDAQSLSARTGQTWVNGYAKVPIGVRTVQFPSAEACVESENRQSLAYCVFHVNPQYRYICEYSGAADRSTHGDVGQPVVSSEKQCICISPQCNRKTELGKVEYGRTWWSCNCNQNDDIVCRKEVADTEEMSPSTPADFTSSPPGITGASDSTSSMATEPSNPESDEQTPVLASPSTGITEDTASTSPLTQDPTYPASDDKTTVFTSLSLSLSSAAAPAAPAASEPSTGLSDRYATLLILLLLVAVIFIIVVVILIIRKRKYARRYETSPLNRTDQNEAVPRGYEIMVRDNRPSGDNIYTELEVTQQPTPSNSNTYASIQPTSEVVDMGKSVDYVDIDFPKKDQQKPKSADKGTVSVSPIYSQPFETPSSDSNTDYVEPYKPDVKPTATAPVQSNQAAADQQNVYSLAKEIPLGDPNVIYSEPNKPTKSSAPTSKPVKAPDPAYVNVIEVKPGTGSEGVSTQDPTAVYAEPIKPEKSS